MYRKSVEEVWAEVTAHVRANSLNATRRTLSESEVCVLQYIEEEARAPHFGGGEADSAPLEVDKVHEGGRRARGGAVVMARAGVRAVVGAGARVDLRLCL